MLVQNAPTYREKQRPTKTKMRGENSLVLSFPPECQPTAHSSRGLWESWSTTVSVSTPQETISETLKVRAKFNRWLSCGCAQHRQAIAQQTTRLLVEKQKFVFLKLNVLYVYMCMRTSICKSLGEMWAALLRVHSLFPRESFFTQPGAHCCSVKQVAGQFHWPSCLPASSTGVNDTRGPPLMTVLSPLPPWGRAGVFVDEK